jgi:hypothetical protein
MGGNQVNTPDKVLAGNNTRASSAGVKEKGHATPSLSGVLTNPTTAAGKHKKNLPHNKVNKTAIPGIASDNEPVADERTLTDKRFSPATSGKDGSAGAGQGTYLRYSYPH